MREVHRAALGAGALSDEWAEVRLPEHTRREGFRFYVAEAEGRVVGFVYGYRGAYGQWWTESVARSLTDAQRAAWLDVPHYEVVELHVQPAWQRSGVGSALLARLLDAQPYETVVLSTQAGSRQARSFYAKNGWTELAPVDFGPGYPPYLVLGRRIAGAGYLPAALET